MSATAEIKKELSEDGRDIIIYDTTYSATRLQIGPSNGEMTVLSNTNFPNGITMNPGTASVVNTIAQLLTSVSQIIF